MSRNRWWILELLRDMIDGGFSRKFFNANYFTQSFHHVRVCLVKAKVEPNLIKLQYRTKRIIVTIKS